MEKMQPVSSKRIEFAYQDEWYDYAILVISAEQNLVERTKTQYSITENLTAYRWNFFN